MLTQLFRHAPAPEPTAQPARRQAAVRVGDRTIPITLHSLSSSLLESAGHDGALMLVLVFHAAPGAASIVCTFSGVSPETFQDLLAASSPGRFYSMSIWNRYPTETVPLALWGC